MGACDIVKLYTQTRRKRARGPGIPYAYPWTGKICDETSSVGGGCTIMNF
jgi:hypothetical protein